MVDPLARRSLAPHPPAPHHKCQVQHSTSVGWLRALTSAKIPSPILANRSASRVARDPVPHHDREMTHEQGGSRHDLELQDFHRSLLQFASATRVAPFLKSVS